MKMRVRRKWPKRRRCPTCHILISGEGLTQYWQRCYWHDILSSMDFAYAVRLAWVWPYIQYRPEGYEGYGWV